MDIYFMKYKKYLFAANLCFTFFYLLKIVYIELFSIMVYRTSFYSKNFVSHPSRKLIDVSNIPALPPGVLGVLDDSWRVF